MTLVISTCEKKDNDLRSDDIVNIPDIQFLSALINEGVDTNGDSLISYGEAEIVTSLDVSCSTHNDIDPCAGPIKCNIFGIKGIEAFINLDSLNCSNVCIKELDVSKNTELKYLDCGYNNLKELDVSKNLKLIHLYCYGWCTLAVHSNGIMESLDISNNILLEYLNCTCQKYDSLDVTKNTELKELYCGGNPFTYLDISKNTELKTLSLHAAVNMTTLNISNNTKLTYVDLCWAKVLNEVCVWTIPFPPEGVSLDMGGECPNVYFTTDCSK
jgi:hypothetical protein